MGYLLSIKSNKDITESEVQSIVNTIPNILKGFQPQYTSIKQPWGCGLYSDVKLPAGDQLVISSSYSMFGGSASQFTNYFIDELKKACSYYNI